MLANGITFGGRNTAELLAHVELAEECGLESVWVGESWGPSAVPIMTQLIERTDSIDVCSGIINIYSRTPGLIAMTANTLAHISEGRFRLGIGASGPAVIEDFHGVEFDAPLRRTREYIELVRAYLRGERVKYSGELFQVSGFALDVEEYYDCPIYVASIGKRNRQLTGQFADGWMPLLLPHTSFEEATYAIEQGAERGGRSPDDVDIAPWVPTCISTERPDAAVDHVRSLIAFYIGAMGDYYANIVSDFGFPEEAEAIQAGWKDNTLSGAKEAVTDELLSVLGACGTPEQAAESFDSFVDAGADSPIAYVPVGWASEEIVRETISHL